MNFSKSVAYYAEEPLTRQTIISLLKDYKRPNDKINELIRQGSLTAVKNGLYIPGPNTNVTAPGPFLVANHLWGPSYVSMEAALSHWDLIPERVYEVSSVTTRAAKIYQTAVGRFSYAHAPLPYYAFGIESVSLTARQVVLIASPEKALCDKIVMTSGVLLRSVVQAKQFLLEDMRMDESVLREMNRAMIRSWISGAPKKNSLGNFVKALDTL